MDYDIIFLSELKCIYPFSIPGYHCTRSLVVPNEEKRGGVAILVKDYLWDELYDVKKLKDQIWFKLRNAPGFCFVAIYVAPRDSPYYAYDSLCAVNEHCSTSNDCLIILGDLNARMHNLDLFSDVTNGVEYRENVDPRTNASGHDLANLLKNCNLKPVNHLVYKGKEFHGNYTFRQKASWISQLDWVIVSSTALQNVMDFDVLHDVPVPTNHAAVAVTLRDITHLQNEVFQRATELGSCIYPKPQRLVPVAMHTVDPNLLVRNLPNVDNMWQPNLDIDDISTQVSCLLYDAARLSRRKDLPRSTPQKRSAGERWKYFLSYHAYGDEKQLWKSIGWIGQFHNSYGHPNQPITNLAASMRN